MPHFPKNDSKFRQKINPKMRGYMIFSIYISTLNGFSMEQYVKDHAVQSNSALPAGNWFKIGLF